MSPEPIQPKIEWEAQDCITCHFVFAAPKSFFDRLRRSGEAFYCPSCGRSMHWTPGETAALKLQKQLQMMHSDMENMAACCQRLEQDNLLLTRSRRAYKAHATRARKRREGAGQ